MRIIKTKVYKYNELNDKAKEKAREWYREGGFNYDWYDCVYEDAEAIGKLFGISIDEGDRGTKIYFSGFSSQGDGACFEGHWRASDIQEGRTKQHAPEDTTIHRIAEVFERIGKQYPHLAMYVKHSGRYNHSRCTDFTYDDAAETDIPDDVEKELIDTMRDFMDWIYKQLETHWDFINADAQAAETIIANEYEFTAEGKRFV